MAPVAPVGAILRSRSLKNRGSARPRLGDAAFAKAKHVVSLRLENNRLTANSLEPRGAIGDYNPADDSYTVYTSTQNPHGTRTVLAQAIFREPEMPADGGCKVTSSP